METFLALCPSIVTILFALLSRNILRALMLGIISGALILSKGPSLKSLEIIWAAFKGIFKNSEGELKFANLCLLGFLITIGGMIHILEVSGAVTAFGRKMRGLFAEARKAKIIIYFMGLMVFIDDYFSALSVGAMSRPLIKTAKISRAKLAYILDTTAGPVCMIAPLSSWGASIILILGDLADKHHLSGATGFSLYLYSIPYNFYSFFTLAVLLGCIISGKNFPLMRQFEAEARAELSPPEVEQDGPAAAGPVLEPLFILSISTIAAMFYSGYLESQSTDIISILSSALIGPALIFGGFMGFSSALWVNRKARVQSVFSLSKDALSYGLKSMGNSILILLFAWMLSFIVGELRAGEVIAGLLGQSGLPFSFLPPAFFIVAGAFSFSTGTSFGTFSMLLPIVIDIALSGGALGSLHLFIGSILGGAVFGDHCSPISDTTVLAASGAGCTPMNHALSQLPYCLLAAGLSLSAYFLSAAFPSWVIHTAFLLSFLLALALLSRKVKSVG